MEALPGSIPGWAEYQQSRWYAVYTCSRRERVVAQQMESRMLECLLPTYRSVRRWKDRRRELALPLFPGYVFVNVSLRERLRVLEIPGVVQMVSFNGKPAFMPDAEIDALRNTLASHAQVIPHPYLRVGSRARVRSGPLSGLEGILVRRKDSCRLVLSIELIMRSLAVEIDEADVEPVG